MFPNYPGRSSSLRVHPAEVYRELQIHRRRTKPIHHECFKGLRTTESTHPRNGIVMCRLPRFQIEFSKLHQELLQKFLPKPSN